MRRTFPHSHRPSLLAPLLQLPNPINHGQHLHRITRTQKMCIVPRCRPKPTTVRLARKHKFYCFISRQCVGAPEEVQSVETPVETRYSEVLCEPVLELIFALRDVSREGGGLVGRRTVSRLWMYFTCGSMASWSSSGRTFPPARPGPDTRDIWRRYDS